MSNLFEKIKINSRPILLLFVSAAVSGLFLYFIYRSSSLAWGAEQRSSVAALIEIFVLCTAVFFALLIPRKNWIKFALVATIVLFFAYMHSFLLPFVVGALHLLLIYMTGYLLAGLLVKNWKCDFAVCAILGISGLVFLVALCSAFRIGTSDDLKIVYIVLFILELVLMRTRLSNILKAFVAEPIQVAKKPVFKYLFLSLAIAGLMIQVGRANVSLDYDSLWYGLRGDDILAPYTGIYDQLMTTAFVYIYPKAAEALMLPFYCKATYGFVYSVNLMFAAITLYVIYMTVSQLCSKKIAIFVTACCSLTAGIMNMAATSKQDVSTLAVQMLMLYLAVRALKERDGGLLLLSIAAGLFSFAFKTTSIVFSSGVIVLVILAAILCRIPVTRRNILGMILPLCATAAIFLRGYLLSGVPMPLFALDLQEALGFTYQYPYVGRDVVATTVSDVLFTPLFWTRLNRVLEFFFWPNSADTSHVIIAWGGYLFTFTWLALVINVLVHPVRTWKHFVENRLYGFSLASLIVISFLSGGSMMMVGQLDGNYFMLMYAITFIHAGVEFYYLPKKQGSKCALSLIPLLVCSLILCVTSNWSWTTGFTPIDLKNPGVYRHDLDRNAYFRVLKVDEICRELEGQERKPRVMIFSGEFPTLQDIPAVSDSWTELIVWGNTEIIETSQSLREYYQAAKMDFLLLDILYFRGIPEVQNHLCALANEGYLSIHMQQNNYFLLKFHAEPQSTDQRLCELLEAVRTADDMTRLQYLMITPLSAYTYKGHSGIFEDGWTLETAQLFARTGDEGHVTIRGIYPFEIEGHEVITVTIGDQITEYKITKQDLEIILGVPINEMIEINISCNFSHVNLPDVRPLGFYITGLEGYTRVE